MCQAGTVLASRRTPLSKEQALSWRIHRRTQKGNPMAPQELCAGFFRSIEEQHLDQLGGPRKAFSGSWCLRLSWRMFKNWLSGHSKGLDTGGLHADHYTMRHGWGRVRQRPRTQHSLTYWEVLVLKTPGSHKGYTVHGHSFILETSHGQQSGGCTGVGMGQAQRPRARQEASVFSGEAMNVWKTKAFSKNDVKIPFTLYPRGSGRILKMYKLQTICLWLGAGAVGLHLCAEAWDALWLYNVSNQLMARPGTLHGSPVHLCGSLI